MTTRVLFVLLLAFAGCSTPLGFQKDSQPEYYKKGYRSAAVTKEEFTEGGMAIAGIVVRDGVELQRTPDLPPLGRSFDHAIQTGNFSPTFEWKYRQKVGAPALTMFREYDDYIPDDLLAETWGDFAQGGYLAPEILQQIHDSEPGVRFIALVRVEHDEVYTSVKTTAISGTVLMNTDYIYDEVTHDPDAVNKSHPPTVARKTGLTMGIFDLEKGICVWEGRTMTELHKSIDPKTLADYEGHRLVDQGSGEYTMVEIEDLSGAPTFTESLEDALNTLFSDLKKGLGGLPGPQRNHSRPEVEEDF